MTVGGLETALEDILVLRSPYNRGARECNSCRCLGRRKADVQCRESDLVRDKTK